MAIEKITNSNETSQSSNKPKSIVLKPGQSFIGGKVVSDAEAIRIRGRRAEAQRARAAEQQRLARSGVTKSTIIVRDDPKGGAPEQVAALVQRGTEVEVITPTKTGGEVRQALVGQTPEGTAAAISDIAARSRTETKKQAIQRISQQSGAQQFQVQQPTDAKQTIRKVSQQQKENTLASSNLTQEQLNSKEFSNLQLALSGQPSVNRFIAKQELINRNANIKNQKLGIANQIQQSYYDTKRILDAPTMQQKRAIIEELRLKDKGKKPVSGVIPIAGLKSSAVAAASSIGKKVLGAGLGIAGSAAAQETTLQVGRQVSLSKEQKNILQKSGLNINTVVNQALASEREKIFQLPEGVSQVSQLPLGQRIGKFGQSFGRELPGVGLSVVKDIKAFEDSVRQQAKASGLSNREIEQIVKAANKDRKVRQSAEVVGALGVEATSEGIGQALLRSKAVKSIGKKVSSPLATFGGVGSRIAVAGVVEGIAGEALQARTRGREFGLKEATQAGLAGGLTAGTIGGLIGTTAIYGAKKTSKGLEIAASTIDILEKPGDLLQKQFSKITQRANKITLLEPTIRVEGSGKNIQRYYDVGLNEKKLSSLKRNQKKEIIKNNNKLKQIQKEIDKQQRVFGSIVSQGTVEIDKGPTIVSKINRRKPRVNVPNKTNIPNNANIPNNTVVPNSINLFQRTYFPRNNNRARTTSFKKPQSNVNVNVSSNVPSFIGTPIPTVVPAGPGMLPPLFPLPAGQGGRGPGTKPKFVYNELNAFFGLKNKSKVKKKSKSRKSIKRKKTRRRAKNVKRKKKR